jgi:hypothetical protein
MSVKRIEIASACKPTVKLFVVLPAFAGVLLSGCPPTTLHPTITVTPKNGGSSFTISGKGFSSGSGPCATLSYDPPSGVTTIKANVPCAGGKFSPDVPWTPAQVPGCTAKTPVSVIAVDHKTATLTWASVSILCEAALCPSSFTEASVGTSMPNYFAGGYSVSGSTYSPGPKELARAWTLSTCVPQFTYTRKSLAQVTTGYVNGVSQSGGFEECTYEIGSVAASPITGCSAIAKAQMEWLQFTCPDSGDCVK